MRDIDVVFLDPVDLTRDNADRAAARLKATWPDPLWEATPSRQAGSPT
ncbi:nucleotidyltransferase family protein [Verrucosispora sp. ts21]|nr:nucleotidyltransferase family protein [Verrucosispora sp. ts21]